MQILLVEDDDALGKMIKARLEAVSLMRNTTVYWKTNLADALRFVSTLRPDVVLLDLGLPDSFGLASFLAIREACPDTPVVVISANDDRDTVVAALREGAQDYIVKGKTDPVAITAILIKSIERHARERAEYRERRVILSKAMTALKQTKHQTRSEAQDTVVEVMGAVLAILSGEGEPLD